MTGKAFTACPWSGTEGEAAAGFYAGIFKDSKPGRADRCTKARPGLAGAVMAADFGLAGQKFVAVFRGPQFTFHEAISFQIPGADQADRHDQRSGLPARNGSPRAMLAMTKLDVVTLQKAYAELTYAAINPILELEDLTMAKALLGHIGGPDPRMLAEMRRLQQQIRDLESQLVRLQQENDELSAEAGNDMLVSVREQAKVERSTTLP
jgi:predicted 3-demethylubiquinone-9 3-methyltransferase (glyoxalase superfamily)